MTTTPRPAPTDDPATAGTPVADPVPLELAAVEVVEPGGPFDARTTLIKPSHFPSPFDAQGEHDYRAVTFVNGQPTGLRASFTDATPTVRLEIHLPAGADADPTAAAAVLRTRLGLDLDLPGYADLCTGDEVLSRLPAAMRGARPSSPWSLYEYLSIGTVLQNTTVSRTVQMARALADLLGTWYRFPDDVVLASFWHPADIVNLGEQALREARLGYRAKTLTRLVPGLKEEYYLLRRRKKSPGHFYRAKKSVKYRLTEHAPNRLSRTLSRRHLARQFHALGFRDFRLEMVDHHTAHARAAARCSGFEACTVLTLDGVGDGLSGRSGGSTFRGRRRGT